LRYKPINPTSENLRNVNESLDVVDNRGFLPQADLSGKRRLVARLSAMAFDRFDECAFFAADVPAGADKSL